MNIKSKVENKIKNGDSIYNFKVGEKVIHKNPIPNGSGRYVAYKGVISNIEKDRIEIDFERLGKRIYSLKHLIEKNLIEVVEN